MRIVIPAAGEGRRFREAGYMEPKPMIDVLGKPMIQRVIDNVAPPFSTVDVISRIDLPKIKGDMRKGIMVNTTVLDHSTRGAVETILCGHISTFERLIIANCDQLADFHIRDLLSEGNDCAGCLIVFPSNKPHHSYVSIDDDGFITDIAEKQVISNLAVTGIYFFSEVSWFLAAAHQVIDHDERVNGEFYVSSVIKIMLKEGAKLRTLSAPTAILGTPEEVQLFEMAARVARKQL